MNNKTRFLVIGLGYVGINLFYNLNKYYHHVYGLDTSRKKVAEIKNNIDSTQQISNLKKIKKKVYNSIKNKKFDIIFICVPTPVKNKKPDLKNIEQAFVSASKFLNSGGVIVNESTVYPGLTRELALKFVNKKHFRLNKNFYLGFSPERISPGDAIPFTKIKRIVASSNNLTFKKISSVYNKILSYKVIKASSLEAAEAVKILENSQRDLNIAMINQFNEIFKKKKLDTKEIINLAASKWNFYKVFPGLVGGQCIPVDPYYAIKYAKSNNFNLSITKLARNINERQKKNILNKILRIYKNKKDILFIGVSYKKNTYDYKYSKIFEIMCSLKKRNINFQFYDFKIKSLTCYKKYFKSIKLSEIKKYNNLIIGNSVDDYQLTRLMNKLSNNNSISIINLASKKINQVKHTFNVEMEPFV